MSCTGAMTTQRFNPMPSPPPRIPSAVQHRRCSVILPASPDNSSIFLNLSPISPGLRGSPRIGLRCNATGDSGENEFTTVLDAFFLGKAVGEALTERIESTVGEFFSVIGKLQSEQLKQLLAFQEDVLDKARRAKQLASLEVMVARGLIKSTSIGVSAVKGVAETTSSVADFVISEAASTVPKGVAETGTLVAGTSSIAGASTTAKGVAETGTSIVNSVISATSSVAEGVAKTGTSVVAGSVISAAPKGVSAVEDVVETGTSVVDSVISTASSAVPSVGKSVTSSIAGSVISKVLKPSHGDPFFGLINKG